MLLYQRFEIPDQWNWSSAQPAPAMDTAIDREVYAFQGVSGSQATNESVTSTLHILAETAPSGALDQDAVEVFLANGFLWIITPRDDSADSFIGIVRAAGLIPAPQIATPPPPPPPPPTPPPPTPKSNVSWKDNRTMGAAQKAKSQAEPEILPPPKPPAMVEKKVEKRQRCLSCSAPVAPGISFCPACGHKIERKSRKILIGSGVAIALLLLVVFASTRSWKPEAPVLDAQLSALNQTITPGRSAVLSWRTQGTTSVTIEPGIGPVEPVGARAVTPRKTTTYTLVASNGSTSVSKQLIVTVARSSMHGADKPSSLPQPAGQQQTSRTAPTALLMANGQQDSATIEEGEQLRLQWNVPGATSVVIQPMVGRVQPSGSSTGNLSSDTTFTLTAIGQGGTTVKTLAVTVAHHAPTLWIKANGSENSTTINLGQAVHICWQAQYADSASLLYQGKSVSVPVTNCFDPKPFTDTTYPITATGKGGNISALVLVHVKLPTQSLRPTPALTPRSGSFSWTGEIDKKKFVRILLMFQKNGAMTPRSFPSGSFSPSLTYQGAAFYGTFPSGITVSSESSQFVVDSVTSGQSGSDLATVYYYVVTVHCQKKGLQKIDLNWRSK